MNSIYFLSIFYSNIIYSFKIKLILINEIPSENILDFSGLNLIDSYILLYNYFYSGDIYNNVPLAFYVLV